jgi:hypothetical protein
MAYAKSASKSLKTRVAHFVQISDGSVGDRPDASQSAMGATIHFSPESTIGIGFVQILNDDDFRTGDRGYIFPILSGRVGIGFRVGSIPRFDDHGHSPTDHWAHLGHKILSFF